MLELQNISFAAEGKEILRNVNLKINDRFVAVTGPNGGGKIHAGQSDHGN